MRLPVRVAALATALLLMAAPAIAQVLAVQAPMLAQLDLEAGEAIWTWPPALDKRVDPHVELSETTGGYYEVRVTVDGVERDPERVDPGRRYQYDAAGGETVTIAARAAIDEFGPDTEGPWSEESAPVRFVVAGEPLPPPPSGDVPLLEALGGHQVRWTPKTNCQSAFLRLFRPGAGSHFLERLIRSNNTSMAPSELDVSAISRPSGTIYAEVLCWPGWVASNRVALPMAADPPPPPDPDPTPDPEPPACEECPVCPDPPVWPDGKFCKPGERLRVQSWSPNADNGLAIVVGCEPVP